MGTSCPHSSQLLFWVDGAMPAGEAEHTAEHVAGCRACSERVAMMRSTVHGRPSGPGRSADEKLQPQVAVRRSRGATPLPPPPLPPPVPSVPPPAPAPAPLGADMAPTAPFLPVETGPEDGGSSAGTRLPPAPGSRAPGRARPPRRPGTLRPRRALGVGVFLVVATGAAVGVGAHVVRGARNPCRVPEARLAGLWDAPRKAALKEAVLGSRLPFALQVWSSMELTLDTYLARWVALRTDVCGAARGQGGQSEQLLGARLGCLGERLDEMAAHLSLVEPGEPRVIENAVQAAQSLTDPRDCQVARGGEPLPLDPRARASAESARRSIAEARALGGAGISARALQRARDAVDAARQGSHRPTLAEAQLLLGELASQTGAPEATAALEEAAFTADAAGQDILRARALAGLSLAVLRQGRAQEAMTFGRLALAALQRGEAPEAHEALEARVHHALALASQAQGRADDAMAHFTRCIELRQRAFGAESFMVAASLQAFGGALYEQGRLDLALERLRQAVALKRQSLGASHPEVGLARQALGVALAARGEHTPALEEQRAAQEILSHSSMDPAVLARLGSETARTLHLLGKGAEALSEQRAALARLEQSPGVQHPAVAEVLLDLAELLVDLGRPKDALPAIARAEELGERAAADSPFRARSAIDLGRVYLAQGRHEQALFLARTAKDRLARGGGPPGLALRASFLEAESLWAGGQRAAAMEEARWAQAALGPMAPVEPAASQLKQWLASR